MESITVAPGHCCSTVSSNKGRRHCCSSLRNRYSHTLVTSKLALLCIFWVSLIQFTDLALWTPWVALSQDYTKHVLIAQAVSCFLSPLFGYIGGKWNRYYVIAMGVFMMFVATSVLLVISYFDYLFYYHNIISVLICNSLLYFLGSGLFISNITQFSLTQLHGACSREVSSFIRWSIYVKYCFIYLCPMLFDESFLIEPKEQLHFNMFAACFICHLVSITIAVGCRRFFIIETQADTLKLVLQVIGYACRKRKNQCTLQTVNHKNKNTTTCTGTSCASCSDPSSTPSRQIDYSMKQYGGPFTPDQVKSVKSFWNTLLVLTMFLVLVCTFYLLYYNGIYYLDCYVYKTASLIYYFIYVACVFVPIPFFQFVLAPLLPGLVSLHRRMWNLVALVAIAFLIIMFPMFMVINVDRFFCVFLFIANEVLIVIGAPVLLFTSLEYLVTHAPSHHILGLQIGIWAIDFNTISKNLLIFFSLSSTTIMVLTSLPCIVLFLHVALTCRFRSACLSMQHKSTKYQPFVHGTEELFLKNTISDVLLEKTIITMSIIRSYLVVYFNRISNLYQELCRVPEAIDE